MNRRTPPILAAVVALAACASPPDRLETAELRPVPRSSDVAAAAGGGPTPLVLPSAQTSAAQELLAKTSARGGATLADCFAFAEMSNEDLLSGDEDRLQAALARDLAYAGVQPTLSFSAYAFAQDRVPSSSGSSSGGASGKPSTVGSDSEQAALTVRQPIFRGFAEFAAIRVADRTEASRKQGIETMRAALRRSVARAFFGVLEAEADVKTLEDSERLDRTRVDEMRAREESGIARRTEVLLLESQLQATLAAVQRAKTQRDVTRAVLDQLLGVDVGATLVHADLAPASVPTREEALAEALTARPEMRAAALAADAAEASVDVSRAGYWPSVAFVGNEYLARSGFSATSKATNWDAQITLDFPLFEGGATKARERTAKSNLRKSRLVESVVLRSVVEDVEVVLRRVATDAALLATFERNAQIATENLGLLREEYAHGIATNLEVLTAQNVLQQAQLDVVRQRLENGLDRVELSIALGRTENDR